LATAAEYMRKAEGLLAAIDEAMEEQPEAVDLGGASVVIRMAAVYAQLAAVAGADGREGPRGGVPLVDRGGVGDLPPGWPFA